MSSTITHPESNPENYHWVNKLISTVYTQPGGGRYSHLFVGEWVKVVNEIDNVWAEVSFRGGQGFIQKENYSCEKYLEVYFLDVGQGDAILIQTPENRRVLIDGGKGKSAHSYLQLKYDLAQYPKVFDLIVLTHGDDDHLTGLTRILKDPNIIPLKIIHSGVAKLKNSQIGKKVTIDEFQYLIDLYDDVTELEHIYSNLSCNFKKWYDAVVSAKQRTIDNGFQFSYSRVDSTSQQIILPGATPLKITIINPILQNIKINGNDTSCLRTFGSSAEATNGNSVGVLIEYGKARFLMCGDMNDKAELLLLENGDNNALNSHIFKAQHHGSQYFTTSFLSKVNPWFSVISSGDSRDYGHPKANLLGSLGKYSDNILEKPSIFSTEIAATFRKIPEKKLKDKSIQGYEKKIQGIIYFKTNGKWLSGGRVFGKSDKPNQKIKTSWKWEAYSYDIATGDPLKCDFTIF
jgi:beta-lactamase superfamily II metal-dependent hydrolase